MASYKFYSEVLRCLCHHTEKFCAWCLKGFIWKDDEPSIETATGLGPKEKCVGETIMMAPTAGFYTDPELGKN